MRRTFFPRPVARAGGVVGWAKPAALLAGVLAATLAGRAVVFKSTGDPAHNTSAAGTVAETAWDLQGDWGVYLGTAIGPHHFVTAKHVGGTVGNAFTFRGLSYTTIERTLHPQADLAVWKVRGRLPAHATLYVGSDEVGQTLVVIGRGTQRGAAVSVNDQLKGWRQGTGDQVRRWGENVVSGVGTLNGSDYLAADFDREAGGNEAHLTVGDSGGGLFLYDSGTATWNLAGINFAVDAHFSVTGAAGTWFRAVLMDMGGLYVGDNNSSTYVPDLEDDLPSRFYAVRISNYADWIANLPPPPVTPLDFGDLPAPYPTSLAQDGPRHILLPDGAFLGSRVDAELDGQPDAQAMGDDGEGESDEDGVEPVLPWIAGKTAVLRVTAGTPGYLSAFLDLDGNGTLDPLTVTFVSGPVPVIAGVVADTFLGEAGVYELSFLVPVGVQGGIPARFRYTSDADQGGASPTGPAASGEVEDHLFPPPEAPPTAVRLDSFAARRDPAGQVRLEWRTLLEVNTLGFQVERWAAGSGWRRVTAGLVPATGSGAGGSAYAWLDDMAPADTGMYRLIEVDLAGRQEVVATTALAPWLTSRVTRSGDRLLIQFRGLPDGFVRIETAGDLGGPWYPVETVPLDALGVGTLRLPIDLETPARFYRAR